MNYTILIADDEPEIRTLLRLYLEYEYYQIIEAENGKQALELLKKDHVDLFLLDIMMPEMDGYEATKRIRNLDDARADIPIVAMTANAFEEDRQKALENGMNAHVSKPIDMNMLFKVMAQILKK